MGRAKQIRVEPISARDAARIVSALHYSGGVVRNSQIHFGVFLDGRCGGAMQFGPSMAQSKMVSLVRGSESYNFVELNRMAFADWLPRNGESRAISVACRLVGEACPDVKWVISFADGTQCGDGTIYRAAGFLLVQIAKNKTLMRAPDGRIYPDITLNLRKTASGRSVLSVLREKGLKPLPGYQLKYVKFIDPSWRERLTVEPIPYERIHEIGATMYRGVAGLRAGSADSGTPATPGGKGRCKSDPGAPPLDLKEQL